MDSITQRIRNFYKTHRRMPSYRELMVLAHYRSPNAARKLADKLVAQGLLSKDSTGKLIPGTDLNMVRILGLVEAGFPSPAEEELSDTITIDNYLIENHESTYLLKVKGDSMIDAGIHQGDMVLVERGRTPRHGDIVIAEVDREWTMKYFHKKGSVISLVPANKKYKPIFPKEELTIAAVVRGVVRKY